MRKDIVADQAAHGALRRAYEAEYRFPPDFGGFEVSVYYSWDRESWAGSVEVRSPADISYEGTIENADGQLRWEIASIVRQCWGTPYEEADGRMRLSLDKEENPLGHLLRVEDGLNSAYRIRGGHISRIERRSGDLKFSINIQERAFTEDGRALPTHFCVVYWSAEWGRIVRTDIYRDGCIPVEGVYSPLGRRITTADDSGVTTRRSSSETTGSFGRLLANHRNRGASRVSSGVRRALRGVTFITLLLVASRCRGLVRSFRIVGLIPLLTVFALFGCGGGGEAGGGGSASEGGRVIEHAMGEAEVPENPERVVVLDTGELDSAITLGITPVGAVEAVEGEGLPSYLEGTGEIENVGTIEQPSLERIAALDPDLILSSNLRHEAIYDQLSEIAPTVFTETTGVTWKENFDLHAEALNRVEEAEQVVREYEGRIDEFQRAMGDRLEQTEVSVVRFLAGDTRIYQKESFIGTVLEDAGLPRPPSQDVDDFAIRNASAELIPEMGGDVIFVTTFGSEEDTALQDITSDPLWQQLEPVQQGRVYEVSDDLWMLGIGYTAANGVMGDLTRYLVEEGSDQR